MVSTYRRRPVYRKPPNGFRYCHKCDAEHPTVQFDKVWDQNCMKWPKIRRGERPPKPDASPVSYVQPEFARWLSGRTGNV